MSLSTIIRSLFKQEVPPSPVDPQSPTDEDIIWEKQLLRERIRRAQELQDEVDLEKRRR